MFKPDMKSAPPREEALFEAAAHLSGLARAAFLDQACAHDAALRQRLAARLAAHLLAEGIPPNQAAAAMLAPTIDLPEPVTDEAVGMTLGRYKLREKLGEGAARSGPGPLWQCPRSAGHFRDRGHEPICRSLLLGGCHQPCPGRGRSRGLPATLPDRRAPFRFDGRGTSG